jgi:PDZ domain-containing protein
VSRRTLTLLLASLLAVGMTLVVAVAKVPYVALAPGPTYNTLAKDETGKPVISIVGRPTYTDAGHLNMTTISVVPSLTLAQALRGWFQHDLAVVPRDVIFPPDQSDGEVRKLDAAAMRQSQDSATSAALKELGLGKVHVLVAKVEPAAPAAGRLQDGDELVAVDGTPVTDARQLRSLIGKREPGQPVRLTYARGGRTAEVTLTTASSTDADGNVRPVIGVQTRERSESPVKVTISLADVGGPSAGLMFALGIYDKLDPGSLTDGRFIAGTGTIDASGLVGGIGGIQQKLIGARDKGATVFLVPADNCREALAAPPPGLRLIKVSTLKGALTDLGRLHTGAATTACTK